jgi:hypothetical protein
VFRYLFDYFPCSVVKTAELDPSNVYARSPFLQLLPKSIGGGLLTRNQPPTQSTKNRYVLAVHPHGTLALNRAIFCFNKQDRYARRPLHHELDT